ncbi:hypothetical protein HGRIS_011209 [Hohenbuehelia grisea]|uniref:HCP-like protein n=1 Tax=Hohenbuehelia grisea TaxID=104357 RepID=A0ABR3JV76_9AGAR
MSAPPVPPRPYESYDSQRQYSSPPPVPPLPPDLRYESPLAAPRPSRVDPGMAHSLESVNLAPGFAIPNRGPSRGPSPLPPPQGANWQPWNLASSPPPPPPPLPYPASSPYQQPFQPPPHPQYPQSNSLNQSLANLAFASPAPPSFHRSQSVVSTYGPPPKAPSPPRPTSSAPSLTAPLPTVPTLLQALSTVQQPSHDPALKIAWARDVLFLVACAQGPVTTDPVVGAANISDPQLSRLAQTAVPLILQLASPNPLPSPIPAHVAEATYWRAILEQTGAFPEYVRQDARSAFRDFESAARSGYHAAWFRLGRDYENFNDTTHAKECFERGVKYGIESCIYRIGMAHLMGQLGLPASVETAIPLLHRAATLASLEVPQPAYVYALLLLSEFSHITVSPAAFAPYIPPGSSPALEARKHLERAAYLHFPPAQYKLGHAYEFAHEPFPFDALLSVQYYSLASQQGETEADMALSKWFLCGAEGAFEKDESLAWTFADKAARKGLPSAMFAMGYYAEVGVGGPKDINSAIRWYTKAAEKGNEDAKERLAALSQPTAQPLSRQEHDNITEAKLVRKRTQAKQRSDAQPQPAPPGPTPINQGPNGRQVIENIRKSSTMPPIAEAPHSQPGRFPAMPEQGGYQSPVPAPSPSISRPDSVQARPPGGSGPGVGPRPGAGSARPYPSAHRFTLTDPGSASASGSPPPPDNRLQPTSGRPSQSPRPNHGRLPSAGSGLGITVAPQRTESPPIQKPGSAKPHKGPTTFAEMGFHGTKAEDKECVIM